MSVIEEQAKFVDDIIKLIQFANSKGLMVTLGEAFRSVEQQQLYVKTGKSKTMNSQHLKRRALDLNFFVGGKLTYDVKYLQEVGDFWEKLDEKNRWGGSWRGLIKQGKSKFKDYPHFERQD